METIVELKAKESQLETELDDIRRKIRDVSISSLKSKLGISVGDKIEFMQGRNKIEGVVSDFIVSWNSVYPIVTLYKKDGTLGLRKTRIWYSEQDSIRKIE